MPALARSPQREHDAQLRSADPEADLADMGRDLGQVAGGQIGGQHRGENRVEARFQPLRQRGDLLRDIIDADDFRAGKAAEDEDIEPPRPPFGDVRPGQREIAADERFQRRRIGVPAPDQPEAAQRRRDRGGRCRHHRQHIGDDQAAGLEQGEGQRQRRDAEHPGFDQRAGPHRRGDIMTKGERRQRDIGHDDGDDDQREQPAPAGHRAGRKHDLRHRDQQRRAAQRREQRQQQRVVQRMGFAIRVRPIGHILGQPAFQPQCRQHRHQFDDHRRIGKAAECFGAVHPPGDEQEREARRQPQDVADETGAPPPRQCCRLGRTFSRHAPADSGHGGRAVIRAPAPNHIAGCGRQ